MGSSSSSPSQKQKAEGVGTRTPSAIEALDDELAVAGVHEGFPVPRRALAGELLGAGWTPDDVALLAAHAVKTSSPPVTLASVLADPERREQRRADLRHIQALRAQRRPDPALWTPQPGEGEDVARWTQIQLARRAYCRVVADRADPRIAAEELGVTVPVLESLVEQGREMSAVVVRKKKPEPDGTHAERVAAFLAQHRKNRPSGS